MYSMHPVRVLVLLLSRSVAAGTSCYSVSCIKVEVFCMDVCAACWCCSCSTLHSATVMDSACTSNNGHPRVNTARALPTADDRPTTRPSARSKVQVPHQAPSSWGSWRLACCSGGSRDSGQPAWRSTPGGTPRSAGTRTAGVQGMHP